MDTIQECPDNDILKKLWNIELAPHQYELITNHLEICPVCEKNLEQIALSEKSNYSPSNHIKLENADLTNHPTGSLFQKIISIGNVDPDREEIISLLSAPRENGIGSLEQYEVVGFLGAGATSIILDGMDRSLKRPVAIKVLRPSLCQDLATRNRFESEALLLAGIRSEYVVSVYETRKWNDLSYLVMPKLEGTTLAVHMEKLNQKPFAIPHAMELAIQLASGLQILHHAGLIHRDIKPSNLWLEKHPLEKTKLVILDLGLAVDRRNSAQNGFQGGTLNFASPEQLAGKTLDKKTDIYSFGCVLFQIFTGLAPFHFQSKREALEYFENGKLPDAKALRDEIPKEICLLIKNMLRIEPSKRVDDAGKILEILKRNSKEPQAILARGKNSRRIWLTTAGLSAFGLFKAIQFFTTETVQANAKYLQLNPMEFKDVDQFILHPCGYQTGILRSKTFSIFRGSSEYKSIDLPEPPTSFRISDCGEVIAFSFAGSQNYLIYSFLELTKILEISIPESMSVKIYGVVSNTNPKKFFYVLGEKFYFVDLDSDLTKSESESVPCEINLASTDPTGQGIAVWSNSNEGSLGIVSPVRLKHTFYGPPGRPFYANKINSDGAIQIRFCQTHVLIGVLSPNDWVGKIDIRKGYNLLAEYRLENISNIGWKSKQMTIFTKKQVHLEETGLLEVLKLNGNYLITSGDSSNQYLAIHLNNKSLYVWKWK